MTPLIVEGNPPPPKKKKKKQQTNKKPQTKQKQQQQQQKIHLLRKAEDHLRENSYEQTSINKAATMKQCRRTVPTSTCLVFAM